MMTKKVLDFDEEEKLNQLKEEEEEDNDEDDEPIYGCRPIFPSDLKLSKDYNDILGIYYACTVDDPEKRPDAKKLEDIFYELNIIIID